MQTKKKSRKFPLGNFLVYILLLSVVFGRVRPVGRALFLFWENERYLLTAPCRGFASKVPF